MKKTLNRTRKHGVASTSRIKRKEREDQLTTDVDVVETTKKSSSSRNKRKEREDHSMSDVDVGKITKRYMKILIKRWVKHASNVDFNAKYAYRAQVMDVVAAEVREHVQMEYGYKMNMKAAFERIKERVSKAI
ncbi:hypothetical protein L1987_57035 [Smallanthus sonchifolius]|uniref:Uncharacterized protein n=1 Tax=Smallanthus sonchifolius TaxID=185202 RepID=A0ACB9DBF1_9ASTR|nr:hypothetical protein L1987_57035 [Smallanthus sonchifolius]